LGFCRNACTQIVICAGLSGAPENLRALNSVSAVCFLGPVVNLYHRDLGGSGKPPLIVLHGLLGSSRNWQSTGADLAARYHVLALDLRNHGRSPHSDEMTFDAMAADVLGWMTSQGIARATLMGHSLGGKVAMLIACRHPERIERLVVVDVAPKDYDLMGHQNDFAALNELDLRTLQSRGEAELRFEARVSSLGMRKFLATNLERDLQTGTWRWIVNLPVLTATLPMLAKNALAPGDKFSAPTLFVVGGKSRYVDVAADRVCIEAAFPSARIAIIADARHNPHMDSRVEFVRAVLEGES